MIFYNNHEINNNKNRNSMDEIEHLRTCKNFIIFYSTKRGFIDLLHTVAFVNSPDKEAVYSIIEQVTTTPSFGETYNLEYKKDFSVVDITLDASFINTTEELTLLVIDKLIDNAAILGVDINRNVLEI